MPLILFKTNLKSLRYGDDRPGGGNSGQPYVQFPIEDSPAPFITQDYFRNQDYYRINRSSSDFPIRGGVISQLVTGDFAALSATIDRERIQKFFNDAPRGTVFIQKQIGLQLTNPRTQVPNSLQFAGLSLGNAILPVTQVYNPLNTLAQVQVQGTGLHFNRHGLAPNVYEAPQQTYAYIAGAPNNNTPGRNRLLILQALKLTGTGGFMSNRATVYDAGVDPLLVEQYGISMIQNQLFNYAGGPGSTYGIGFTRIFRATNTQPVGDETTDLVYSNIAFTYAQIAAQTTRNGVAPTQPTLQDFRFQLANLDVPFSFYKTSNIEFRLNVGNPGAAGNKIDKYAYNDTKSVRAQNATDRLNFLSPFYYNPGSDTPWTAAAKITPGEDPSKDIIKFAFECLSNDTADSTNAKAIAIIFRAFLDGSISDSNTAEYSSFKYLGRGETFRTYQGFDRTIGFSFKAYAQTRREMRPLYQKLNQLISQVYPDYSQTYNIMRGSVVKLTIGDYLYRVPGFLENVNVTIDNSNTPWEILLNDDNDDDVRQLPHMVTVQCSFKPIMDILPRRQTAASPNVPLIVTLDNFATIGLPPTVAATTTTTAGAAGVAATQTPAEKAAADAAAASSGAASSSSGGTAKASGKSKTGSKSKADKTSAKSLAVKPPYTPPPVEQNRKAGYLAAGNGPDPVNMNDYDALPTAKGTLYLSKNQ